MCFFLEAEHLFQSVGCARNEQSVSHSSTESEVISLDYEWMGYLLLTEGNIVIEVLRTTKDNPRTTFNLVTLRESWADPTVPYQLRENWRNEYNRKKS